MKAILESVTIDAAPRWVWHVVSALPRYAVWNPLVREASGRLERDQLVSLTVAPTEGAVRRVPARVSEVDRERRVVLRWRGSWTSCFLTIRHRLELKPLARSRTRCEHEVEVTGLLAPVYGPCYRRRLAPGLADMHAALKRRAERIDRVARLVGARQAVRASRRRRVRTMAGGRDGTDDQREG
jgi:hypothetical protein